MTTTETENQTAPDPAQPRSRWSRVKWPIIGVGGLAAATLFVARFDPNTVSYPGCPMKMVTGLDCPGCGGLRCVHALASGDIGAAMDQNVLAVIFLPLAALWVAMTVLRRWRGQRPVDISGGSAVVANSIWIGIIILLVVFTIVRNLPAVGFLQSGIG